MKKKTIKVWAVIWSKKGRLEYGVPLRDLIITVEPNGDSLAIFSKRAQAVAYRNGNPDFQITPITYSLSLTN